MHSIARATKTLSQQEECGPERQNMTSIALCFKLRAFQFAQVMCDEKTLTECREYDCDSFKRTTPGVPDYPFSLMEGVAGELSLLCDLLSREDHVRFPAYEM
jgi:hypothetical protein